MKRIGILIFSVLLVAGLASEAFATALTADKAVGTTAGMVGATARYPVAASTTIYQGALVCINSSGYAIPADDASGYHLVGYAVSQADNSSGSAADLYVVCEMGGAVKVVSSGLSAADEGVMAYVTDDQTVSTTPGYVPAGIITEYVSATACYIAPWSGYIASDYTGMVVGTSLNDVNGNEMLEFTVTAAAVNHIGLINAATGTNPVIVCEGEADTGIDIENKDGEEIAVFNSIASSVNYPQVDSSATGNSVAIGAKGDDANVGFDFKSKGTGLGALVGDDTDCITWKKDTNAYLGFFGVTAAVRPSALTQTYSTADGTHAALTSATLTDSSGGSANTTVAAITGGGADAPSNASATELNDNFADLTAQINALRVDLEDAKQFINQIADDLQTLGLAQ